MDNLEAQNLTKAVNGLAAAIIALIASTNGGASVGSAQLAGATPTNPATNAQTPATGAKAAAAPAAGKADKGKAKPATNLREPADPLKDSSPVTSAGTEPALSKDEIRNLLKSVNSREFSMATLARFGVTTLSALDAKHYAEVAKMVEVELQRMALETGGETDPDADPTDE